MDAPRADAEGNTNAVDNVDMQQSGYATDIVAIRDVVGNVHCTTFHVRFVPPRSSHFILIYTDYCTLNF